MAVDEAVVTLTAGDRQGESPDTMRDMMILGIDTGGTFTDFVLFDGKGLRIHKVLSTP